MTYPEVQFVAAPEDGAEVLFDFNDNMPGEAPAQIVTGSFTLGTPEIIGDPDGLGVQYGPRVVGFSLLIYGNRQAARETQALLARTFMLRRRGWLRIKLDEFSAPVWLRTYTPTPAELDFSLIAPGSEVDAWQLEVEVAAEPFIRGERIEHGPYSINNDPANPTNPMGVTLPTVIGDAPAPLRIEAAFSHTYDQHDILWSTAAVPDSYAPIVWQIGEADGWVLVTDVSASVSNAGYSGGSYRRVTFATNAGMATRIAGPAPTAPRPGRYKVLLRVGRSGPGATFAFRFGYNTALGQIYKGPTVVMDRGPDASGLHVTWVDLGDFDFPLPRTSVDIASPTTVPNIALAAQRLNADAGECLLDALVLLPLDVADISTLESSEKADVLVSEFSGRGPQAIAGDVQIWDGESEACVRTNTAGEVDTLISPANRGAFPTVRPGVSNRLSLVPQVRLSSGDFGTVDNPDVFGATAAVTVSYQPRWLWLGDS